MDIQAKFSRARLATLVVGTGMLQSLFEEKVEHFLFHVRLKEKCGILKFNPSSWNFSDLYDLCTKGLIEKLEPSESWMTCSVNPEDITLGDDIKRLYQLINKFKELETDLTRYKSMHPRICGILKDVIKRFTGSEGKDFANIYQYIMYEKEVDEIESDLEFILRKGQTNLLLQKYEREQNKQELYTSSKSEKNEEECYIPESSPEERMEAPIASNDTKNIAKIGEYNWKHTAKRKDQHLGTCQETRIKDEKAANSLDGNGNENLKFVKWQIYFDFVPPSMNNFDYTMNKLSNIERCLQNLFPSNSALEPMLYKYMSFTFVHGDHMSLQDASMGLFEAEPEEKQDDSNDSGIVVVYLDSNMTIDMVDIAMKNTGNLKIGRTGICAFLAVHSETLLQDKERLTRLLKPIFGHQLEILDANGKMLELYRKFTKVKSQAIKDTEKRIKEVKGIFGGNEKLNALEEQISKLHLEDNQSENGCGIREKKMWSKQTFSWLKAQGLQGYTKQNNILILCFHRLPTHTKITRSMLPEEVRKRYPDLKIIQSKDPLFKLHHEITSGDKLHPVQWQAGSYGTVGMFGTIRNSDGFTRHCCISSPHVISSGQPAYIFNAKIKLGTCVWPPVACRHSINVEDISVIPLELERNLKIVRNIEERVNIFDGNRHNLMQRKVYKFGATTSRTTGYIQNTDFVLTIGNSVNVFLIEPDNNDGDDSSRFSKPGDSGAIVLTKLGGQVKAISMIFGGEVNLEGVAKNISIAVDLNQAVERYKANNEGGSLQLDTI